MKIELFENLVDEIQSFVAVVDLEEGAACGIDRQGGDVETPAIWGYGFDAGCDDNTDVGKLA